ncbi:YfiT family bacillithiol transferase [Chitinophaga lutea]
MEDLRYPIGRFQPPALVTPDMRKRFINDIRHLPSLLELAIQGLDEHQLQTPYRPGGWTVAQVVHHLADSHLNGLTRAKLALTEDNPTIKPYDEAAWAELADVQYVPVNVSVTLLHALHARWVALLEHLEARHWDRTFFHPGNNTSYTLSRHLATYSWHGLHHLAHIERLKERENWK